MQSKVVYVGGNSKIISKKTRPKSHLQLKVYVLVEITLELIYNSRFVMRVGLLF